MERTTSGPFIMSPTNPKIAPSPPQHQYALVQPGSSSFQPPENTGRRHHSQAFSRGGPTPRSMQNQRKSNKAHRRPRLQDDEDALAEHDAVRAAGSRRGQTSITHLMSFALPPRPSGHSTPSGRSNRRNPIWGIGSGYHATDKARYIHANYRFVVDPHGDYSAQMANSDIHLEWEQVWQVLATVTEDTSCPICLSRPVAPRMAKCGHIFCLPCVIRYLHATNEGESIPVKKRRWKSCPICFDTIYMHEMRPVRWIASSSLDAPRDGHDVVLRLLVRNPGSTLALPRDIADTHAPRDDVPWHFTAEVFESAHFVKGSKSYLLEQYNIEIDALRIQEQEDELLFGEDTIWSRKAIAAIEELKEKAGSMEESELVDFNVGNSRPDASLGVNDQPFYFYQASSHSYLSPLDIRILKATFGDFSAFPATLLPRVEHVSTGHVVDEEIRRRAKYLSHLPLGREISFLECDWTDIVPTSTLQAFNNDLEKRRQRNREKASREEKARVRAELSEDKKLYGTRRQRQEFIKQPDGLETLSHHDFTEEAHSPIGISSTSRSPSLDPMLGHATTSIATLASPIGSPSGPRTVWGTPAIPSNLLEDAVLFEDNQIQSNDDGWLHDWERQLPDDQYIVDKAGTIELADAESAPISQSVDGQKKKKKKTKITLMSTNGRRAA